MNHGEVYWMLKVILLLEAGAGFILCVKVPSREDLESTWSCLKRLVGGRGTFLILCLQCEPQLNKVFYILSCNAFAVRVINTPFAGVILIYGKICFIKLFQIVILMKILLLFSYYNLRIT